MPELRQLLPLPGLQRSLAEACDNMGFSHKRRPRVVMYSDYTGILAGSFWRASVKVCSVEGVVENPDL